MRVMLKVSIPVEQGNKGITEGFLPSTVMNFVETMKPECSYFFPEGGFRTALFFFNLESPDMIPTAVEPFFRNLNAAIELTPAMNLEDMKTGVAKAVAKG